MKVEVAGAQRAGSGLEASRFGLKMTVKTKSGSPAGDLWGPLRRSFGLGKSGPQ